MNTRNTSLSEECNQHSKERNQNKIFGCNYNNERPSPAPARTPLTPPASTSSSLDLKASSWSVVMSAEAANWALAWSSVLDASAWTETRHRTSGPVQQKNSRSAQHV